MATTPAWSSTSARPSQPPRPRRELLRSLADPAPAKHLTLDVVHDFEALLCTTEWEALLTENRLIKDIKPRFNARLTDDKTFPYLAITRAEDFPARCHHPQPFRPGVQGRPRCRPFTNAGALREAVQVLQRALPPASAPATSTSPRAVMQ